MSWNSVTASDGSIMDLWVERPAAPTAAAVLVIQEVAGVNSHIRNVARRVAELGYVAVAPDLYHRTATHFEGTYDDLAPSVAHAKQMIPANLAADLHAAYQWLVSDEQADDGRVAAWGFCMGGRVALRANMLLPLRGAVSFYGGASPEILADVARSHGPVLLAWGGRDPHIAYETRRSLVEALAAAKKPYTDVEFSEAEHGFFCDERASYHVSSARQAWALTQVFFEERLAR
jgi:carboxymethylenebutenolidase